MSRRRLSKRKRKKRLAGQPAGVKAFTLTSKHSGQTYTVMRAGAMDYFVRSDSQDDNVAEVWRSPAWAAHENHKKRAWCVRMLRGGSDHQTTHLTFTEAVWEAVYGYERNMVRRVEEACLRDERSDDTSYYMM